MFSPVLYNAPFIYRAMYTVKATKQYTLLPYVRDSCTVFVYTAYQPPCIFATFTSAVVQTAGGRGGE